MAGPAQPPFDHQRLGLLDRINRSLKEGQESFDDVLRVGACTLVPHFADLCVILTDGRGNPDGLEVAHSVPGREQEVRSAVENVLPAVRSAARRALAQDREFRWIPKLNGTSLRFLRNEPELVELLFQLEIHSLIVVPVRAGGNLFGGMALCRTRAAAFSAMDLALAQVVVRRIAAAAQNARMYEQALDERSRRVRLEAAVQKWIQVFDLAGWGAAIVDGYDFRIEAANPAFASLHGYASPTTLAGRLFTDVLAPSQADEPSRWNGGRDGSPYESLHIQADGGIVPVLTTVTPIRSELGGESYVVTVQDLTELKRTEERLRRAQRLEAVGRLAGGVAHEVNNMMTIILGFTDLLSRSGSIPSERQRELEEIRKAATRAGSTTQQLLAFSRQQILQPVELDLNEAVTELLPALELLLPANVVVETALSDPGVAVLADRAQLQQVLINLAFNARDAMPGGGTLRLLTASRWLTEDDGHRLIGIPIPPGRYATISVVDTGHGMDAATLGQVFEPFFTTKPVGSGTGLGLATVYGIVKQSGGYVWVESTPGMGTTFNISLPQCEQPARSSRAEPARQNPAARCPSGTVLLVEDEEGVRDLARRVLEQQGHRVFEASTGPAALTILEQSGQDLDLVLSDVIVPEIGTIEFAQQLHRHRPELPILYMSGYSREEVLDRGLIPAEVAFLQKPFTADELTTMVCQQLAGAAAAG